ncbi:unnamed protein product [Diatraea saccharalis]|uniref:Uncharacterized protein n=1 Tax=Diatraea saccharalis TaxID=40085 RepID=A0A9N9QVA5_9NEOP|nr:unnamed protein product [Diatraea saccharalis]
MQRNLELIMQVETVSLDTVMNVEKYLEPGEIISLMFLLNEPCEKTLEILIAYQRASKIEGNTSNILLNWAIETSKKESWKWLFVDALLTCQLNSVIKKMGIDIRGLKKHILLNQQDYIDPIKKHIYKICENINNNLYIKIKRILYENNDFLLDDHESCEIVFLKLMCKKIFTISSEDLKLEVNVNKLVNVLDQIQELRELSIEMKYLATVNINPSKALCDTPKTSCKQKESTEKNEDTKLHIDDFDETFTLLNQIWIEDINLKLKCD